MDLSPESRTRLVRLAAETIHFHFHAPPGAALLPDKINAPAAGCFVSLHRKNNHALRGCIGVFDPSRPLGDMLVSAAQSALRDPRFTAEPITAAELSQLELEITVLDPLLRAPSTLAFDPRQHGIYLTVQQKSGCFLPQVGRSTGWSREQLLTRLSVEKLGLPPDAWRDPSAVLQTFTAQIIGPTPLD
jgi:AmmeMemoRadiSam system protein A